MKPLAILCFLFYLLSYQLVCAQDSTLSGTIRVKRLSDSTATDSGGTEDKTHDVIPRLWRGVYHHGPVAGLDYSNYFGYRIGFQYSDHNFILRLCFKHIVSEKLAGASAGAELPMSVLFGRSSSAYTYRIGSEWTSLGRSNSWYQSLNFYFSKAFILPRGPNIILNVGYQINPIKKQTENISISGPSASLILHF